MNHYAARGIDRRRVRSRGPGVSWSRTNLWHQGGEGPLNRWGGQTVRSDGLISGVPGTSNDTELEKLKKRLQFVAATFRLGFESAMLGRSDRPV
jgi:hypothetical protein